MEKQIKSNSQFICSELKCAKKCHLHDALRKVINRVGVPELDIDGSRYLQNIGAGYFRGCDLVVDFQKIMLEFGII